MKQADPGKACREFIRQVKHFEDLLQMPSPENNKPMKIKVCGMRGLKTSKPWRHCRWIWWASSSMRVRRRFAEGKLANSWQKKGGAGRQKRVRVFVNAEVEGVLNHVHDFELDL